MTANREQQPQITRNTQQETPSVECLMRRYHYELIPLLKSFGCCHADAEDLAQDAIITAWLWFGRADLIEDWDKWLRTVAIRAAQKCLKGKKFVELTVEPADRSSAIEELEQQEEIDALSIALADAVSALPERLREIFMFCSVNGNTYTDAVEQFQISLGALRNALRSTRSKLQSALRSQGIDI